MSLEKVHIAFRVQDYTGGDGMKTFKMMMEHGGYKEVYL
jgi:hypothetical protein